MGLRLKSEKKKTFVEFSKLDLKEVFLVVKHQKYALKVKFEVVLLKNEGVPIDHAIVCN